MLRLNGRTSYSKYIACSVLAFPMLAMAAPPLELGGDKGGTSSKSHSSTTTTHHSASTSVLPSPSPAPTPEPLALCDDYSATSRKRAICDSYSENNAEVVSQLPKAADLKPGTLYIVTKATDSVAAPYVLPEGTSIIPAPKLVTTAEMAPLTLSYTGSGKNKDCDFCVVSLGEQSRIAGIRIDGSHADLMDDTDEGSGHEPEKAKSLIYGQTTSSEISEVELKGAAGLDSLIFQRSVTDQDSSTVQSYDTIYMDLNGADNGVRVDSSDGERVDSGKNSQANWDVNAQNLKIKLSGVPEGNIQSAIKMTNIRPMIGNSDINFDNNTAHAMHDRYGIYLHETPKASIYSIRERSALGKMRQQDIQVFIEGEQDIEVILDGNAYSWWAREVVTSVTGKLDIYQGPEAVCKDMEQDNGSIEHLMGISGSLGTVNIPVAELGSVCSQLAQGHYDRNNPLLKYRPMGSIPNATEHSLINPDTFDCNCQELPWYANKLYFGLTCGGSGLVGIAAGVVIIGGGKWLVGKVKNRKRSGYQPIKSTTDDTD